MGVGKTWAYSAWSQRMPGQPGQPFELQPRRLLQPADKFLDVLWGNAAKLWDPS